MKLDAFLPTRGGFDCWMEVKSSQINPIYVTHLKTTAVVPKCKMYEMYVGAQNNYCGQVLFIEHLIDHVQIIKIT